MRVTGVQEKSDPGGTGLLRLWGRRGTEFASRMGRLGLWRGKGTSGKQLEIGLSIT